MQAGNAGGGGMAMASGGWKSVTNHHDVTAQRQLTQHKVNDLAAPCAIVWQLPMDERNAFLNEPPSLTSETTLLQDTDST